MGSIIAMAAVVAVVAGIATVTTKKLQSVFSASAPKAQELISMLQGWRNSLLDNRKSLVKLKDNEMDLLCYNLAVDPKLMSGKNRTAGTVQTIYKENIAYFVKQDYPKAKTPTALTLIQTSEREFTYKTVGEEIFVSSNAKPLGILRKSVLYSESDKSALVSLEKQRDGRTVHIDRASRTLGIIVYSGAGRAAAPRVFEFVDVCEKGDRELLELMTFNFLLSQNLQA